MAQAAHFNESTLWCVLVFVVGGGDTQCRPASARFSERAVAAAASQLPAAADTTQSAVRALPPRIIMCSGVNGVPKPQTGWLCWCCCTSYTDSPTFCAQAARPQEARCPGYILDPLKPSASCTVHLIHVHSLCLSTFPPPPHTHTKALLASTCTQQLLCRVQGLKFDLSAHT